MVSLMQHSGQETNGTKRARDAGFRRGVYVEMEGM